MVDSPKNARIRQIFTTWRRELAVRETAELNTALLISDYVEQASLAQIQADIVNKNSPVFRHISQYKQRTFGSLLFAKLTLIDYLQQRQENESITSEETNIIEAMVVNLDSLYTNFRNHPKANLDALINTAHLWLDQYALTDPAKTKAVALSFYTIQKLLRITIDKLGFLTRNVANQLIELDNKIVALEALIAKTQDKLVEIENALPAPEPAPPVVVEVAPAVPATPTSLEEHLNTQYVELLNSDLALDDKMRAISEALDVENTNITRLIQLRTNRADLESQMEHPINLLGALKLNDNKIKGREYALAIITNYRDEFDYLLEKSSAPVKLAWAQRLQELEAPSRSRKIVNNVQSLFSWANVVPISLFRTFTSAKIQQKVHDYVPATLDSDTKDQLYVLANTRLQHISAELDAITIEINEVSTQLTYGHAAINSLVVNATNDELEQALRVNRALRNLVGDYANLYRDVLSNEQKLHEIQNLNYEIEAFLIIHNNFYVKLSNFFSQIWSIFKTEAATRVDEAIQMRTELRNLKTRYEHTIADNINLINSNPSISPNLKTMLVDQLTSQEESAQNAPAPQEEEAAPIDQRVAENRYHTFSRIQTRYQEMVVASEMADLEREAEIAPLVLN